MSPVNKADVIARVHEAENETLESGTVSEQVAQFISDTKAANDANVATLTEALTKAQEAALTDAEGEEAMTALQGIIDGNNNLQRVLTAAITPAAQPLPPEPTPEPLGKGKRRR